jgi:hypothetical protein
MGVTQRYRKGVRRIDLKRHPVIQQHGNHVTYLGLVGMANTHHCLLHSASSVFEHLGSRVEGRADGSGSRLAKFQGGIRVTRHEHLLHSHGRGTVLRHETLHGGKNYFQTIWQSIDARSDRAAGDVNRPPTVRVDDAKTRYP